MRPHGIMAALAFMLLAALPVWAGDMANCAQAKAHPALAVPSCRRLSRVGSAWAQLQLGLIYKYGWGTREDDVAAGKWLGRAAEHGSVRAQYLLGTMYERGLGVPRSDFAAVKWYRLASHESYSDAENNLGSMYLRGRGVPRSP